MRHIAVLGSNGYIGSYLVNALQDNYNVYSVNRTVVDLTNLKNVCTFFKNNNFDVVINCAGNLNSNLVSFDERAYYANVTIFNNLLATKHYFKKLINFGSGAEFNRRFNIDNKSEDELENSFPKDHYGKSKNLISRICNNTDNFYTLRLFGVFSSGEPSHRLLQKVLFLTGVKLQNRYFDYFYLEDILPVIEHYINNDNLDKDINLVYQEKIKIYEFVNRFIEYHNLDKRIDIVENGLNYTGNGDKLNSLGLNFKGLDYGLRNYV